MFNSLKQNVLLLIFVTLTCNILLLTGAGILQHAPKPPAPTGFDIIDCSDSAGQIHKCIRVDAKAGEINDPIKGATYRVIYGQ